MAPSDLSRELQQLLAEHIPSMDHVAILLALRDAPERALRAPQLTADTRLAPDVTERVLRELVASRLAERHEDSYHYAPAAEVRVAAEELTEMYRTRPVTLVRAIYDRPARAVASFADAFRLRKPGE